MIIYAVCTPAPEPIADGQICLDLYFLSSEFVHLTPCGDHIPYRVIQREDQRHNIYYV